MTVHKTAYQTTACRDFAMKKTIDALQAARADGWLPSAAVRPAYTTHMLESNNQINQHVRLLEGGSSIADAVPPFAHPVLLEQRDGEPMVVVDVRGYGRWDPHQMRFSVRNVIDYNFTLVRGALDQIWNSESPTILRDINQQPMAIFSAWLSEAISRRFSLDPAEQYTLSILAAIFYNSQFVEKDQHEQLSDNDKNRAAAAITRALRVKAEDVFAILDKDSVIPDVANFCMAAKENTGSIRLNELNTGLVFSIMGGTWFGANSREIVAVALEHPPTWQAILLTAINERTYKNSSIARLTERFISKNNDQFVPSLLNLIRLHAR